MESGDTTLNDGVVAPRPLREEDATDHLAGEDAELVRWLSGGPGTEETVRSYIARARQMWPRRAGVRLRHPFSGR